MANLKLERWQAAEADCTKVSTSAGIHHKPTACCCFLFFRFSGQFREDTNTRVAHVVTWQALETDDRNVKVLYRRAVARQKLKKFKAALNDVKRTLGVERTNKQAISLKVALEASLKTQIAAAEKEREERALEEKRKVEELLARQKLAKAQAAPRKKVRVYSW